ncbi:unnamed protein product [Rhizopus stolonifer]
MGNVASKRKRSKTIKKPIPEPTPEEDSVTNPASQSEISGNTYWLPNHYEELDRLSSQHFALKILYDGNFSKVIKSDMDCATVLDLGCGPGTWLMDVATEFPSSQFHGIDLFDIFPTVIRPPNVHFQVHDALKGLPFPDNTFDIVNTRMFILAVKKHEWSIVFKEILRVLKPGGFIQSCECSIVVGVPFFFVGHNLLLFNRKQGPNLLKRQQKHLKKVCLIENKIPLWVDN